MSSSVEIRSSAFRSISSNFEAGIADFSWRDSISSRSDLIPISFFRSRAVFVSVLGTCSLNFLGRNYSIIINNTIIFDRDMAI
jgi:hypothetical protein